MGSLGTFEKALGKEHGDYILCANNLVGFLKMLGNFEKAEQLLLEVRDIQEKVHGKESPKYGESLSGLASLYHTMGNYEKAELLFLEGIHIREKVFGKDAPENLGSLANLAFLYKDMGNYDKAEQLFLQAKPGWENKPRKEYCTCTGAEHLNDLAGFYHSTGNYEKAELLYFEADTISKKIWGRGEYPDYPRNLTGRANLYKDMGNYEKSEPLFEELAQLHQSLITSGILYMSQRELNNYLNKFSESQAQMLSFAQITADKGARIHPVCYDNILFYKGFLLNTSNQIKRLALTDNTATENFNLLKSYERRLAAEYAKPNAERKNLPELEAKANDLEKELARTVAGYGEAMQQVRWQEVQQKLKAGEAAVEFIHYRYYNKKRTDSTMYAALVLLPGDEAPQFVPLFEEREIAPFLKNTKGGNIRGINALYSTSGQKSLYDLIWQPLDGLLQGTTTVYCSPSGLLHKLNLGAIPMNDGQTFADKHPLVLMNSTRQLVIPNATIDALNDAFVVGGVRYEVDSSDIAAVNTDFATRSMSPSLELDELPFHADSTSRGGTWNYLPGTAKEAHDISRILKAAHLATQLDTGYIASEESFRSLGIDYPSPSILHIATHGFFFPDPKEVRVNSPSGAGGEPVFKISEHPMIRSGLILAGAQQAWATGKAPENREDGILTAYEISQMNLSGTELVVLSACETGLGDIEGNEGVYGLQRAFKIAGAKYLMMSLWKVNDQSTRELMTDFYQQWLTNGLTIPDVFRTAQSNMKKKYPDAPYHWAGFVLVE
ncbi:MAG: CHAT domain-containing protein [Saprospiraceae bacterium]|nr:CHAT domain-containing protein [Saprospiraceae bacterium]